MSQMISPNQRMYKHEKTGRIHVETVNNEPSLTHQEFERECDINQIMKKFDTTGEISHWSRRRGVYGDFSNLGTYEESLTTVMRAQEAFAELSAELRQRFRNDPAELIEFLGDEKNFEEAMKLGLLDKNSLPKQNSSYVEKNGENAKNDLNDKRDQSSNIPNSNSNSKTSDGSASQNPSGPGRS